MTETMTETMTEQPQINTFWWFLPGQAGGMGRPGFNRCHWFDLSLEGGVLLTWIGEGAASEGSFADLGPYLEAYGPKVAPFFDLSVAEVKVRLDRLRDPAALLAALERLNASTGVLRDLAPGHDGVVRYALETAPLRQDLAALERMGISVIISLMEIEPSPELRAAGFEVHHLPVSDVTPPALDQVRVFSRILHGALEAGQRMVTHCLAGVGRTTTMYLASALLQGRPWEELVQHVALCNPRYQLKGPQVEFLRRLAGSAQSSGEK